MEGGGGREGGRASRGPRRGEAKSIWVERREVTRGKEEGREWRKKWKRRGRRRAGREEGGRRESHCPRRRTEGKGKEEAGGREEGMKVEGRGRKQRALRLTIARVARACLFLWPVDGVVREGGREEGREGG